MMIAIELMLCAMLGMIPSIFVFLNDHSLAFAAEIFGWVAVGVLFTMVINKYREADASASEAGAGTSEAGAGTSTSASEAGAGVGTDANTNTGAGTGTDESSSEDDDISALKLRIEDESEKTRRLQSVVYHMMGKLYDDERVLQTQEIDYLYGKTPIGENENIHVDTVPNEERIDQCTTLEECIKQIAELKAEVKAQEERFSSDYWSFNDIFMRMHDVEEQVVDLQFRL